MRFAHRQNKPKNAHAKWTFITIYNCAQYRLVIYMWIAIARLSALIDKCISLQRRRLNYSVRVIVCL